MVDEWTISKLQGLEQRKVRPSLWKIMKGFEVHFQEPRAMIRRCYGATWGFLQPCRRLGDNSMHLIWMRSETMGNIL